MNNSKLKFYQLFMFFLITAVLSSCSSAKPKEISEVSGAYEYVSDVGEHTYMVFSAENGENTVLTNILGNPVQGAFKVTGQSVDVIIPILGQEQTFTGNIDKDTIVFSEVTLTKVEKLYEPPTGETGEAEKPEVKPEAAVYPSVGLETEITNSLVTDYHMINISCDI